MVHKLAIVAVIGLTGSAICMGAAAAIGGKEFGKDFDGMDFSMFGDRPRCEMIKGANATSRTMDWDGSDHVDLKSVGQGQSVDLGGRRILKTRDPQMLAHVRVRDGRIEMDCRSG